MTAPNIYNVERFDGGTLKSGIADLLLDGMMGSEATVIDAGSGAKESFKHNLESTFDMLKSIGVIDNDYEGSVGTGKYLFNESKKSLIAGESYIDEIKKLNFEIKNI